MLLQQIRSFLIAKSYNFAMAGTEKRCLNQWRKDLLGFASGDLLEIGAGTGVNLPHYHAKISSITLSEPDQQMRKHLQRTVAQTTNDNFTIKPWEAAEIDLPDASFDTIVSTLVLCSVPCLTSSLNEIYRLLRPGGKLLFLEHIASDQQDTFKWQQRIEPIWSLCAGNCRLTRDTATAISNCGLSIEQLIDAPMDGTPNFVSRTIRGIAVK